MVPLTVFSALSTVHLTVGGTSTGSDEAPAGDDIQMPAEALDDPASYSLPGRLSLSVADERAHEVVAAASTNGIPAAALAAYRRAETVMEASDLSCHIPWQLIAAVGRVESDHGRYGGNVLTTSGLSRPGVYGIRLDGRHHTAVIRDTDAGIYDRDDVYDRAVGPLQVIPSTWAVVGVDADGDGQRNPQDIDDASLAAAVYLCSEGDDLDTEAGRRAAVFRYNRSHEYVALVLAIMHAYMAGDYASVPNYTTSAVAFTPDPDHAAPHRHHGNRHHGALPAGNHGATADPVDATPAPTPQPQPGPGPDPTDDDPVKAITTTVKQAEQGLQDAEGEILTLAQATLRCTSEGYNPLLTPAAWSHCIHDLTE